MMMLRGRGPAAATAGVAVRRSLWLKLVTRVFSSSIVQDEEQEEHVNPIKRVPTTTQQKRAVVAATTKENEKRMYALLPVVLGAYKKAVGHYIIPFDLKASASGTRSVHKPCGDGTSRETTDLVDSSRYFRVCGRVCDTSEIDWPEEVIAQRFSIGRCLHSFMTKETHRDNHPQVVAALRDIGFPVDEATHDWTLFVWNHEVMVVLRRFYELNGHSLVPKDFVVPRGDPQWLETTWGYQLGCRVRDIRTKKDKLAASQLADLQQIEFPFDAKEHMWTKRILPSLQVFHQVDGHCDVHRGFVVPSQEPWPQEAWGLKLGKVVNGMRVESVYTTQISRDADHLQAIEFVWDSYDNRWKTIVLPTLEMYFWMFGHMDITRDFVVPSQSPWIKRAWGLKPGHFLHNIKYRNDYAEQRRRDSERLQAIGLGWICAED